MNKNINDNHYRLRDVLLTTYSLLSTSFVYFLTSILKRIARLILDKQAQRTHDKYSKVLIISSIYLPTKTIDSQRRVLYESAIRNTRRQ